MGRLIICSSATKPTLGGKKLFMGSRRKAVTAPAPAPGVDPLLGQFVAFDMDGTTVVGQVSKAVSADNYTVKLCLPNKDGLLLVTDSEIIHPRTGLDTVKAASAKEAKVRRWEERFPWTVDRKMVEIKDDATKQIMDYRDVSIEGFASTFKGTTPADRDGDYVMDGAFDDTLADFLQNPVMLYDHRNSVDYIAGSYSKVSVTSTGLADRWDISNAPELRKIRFLIVEGHLKAFSIGGLFLYSEDGRGIEEIRLWEVSLVAIPANQDALFQVRSIGTPEMKSLWTEGGVQNRLRNWVH